MSLGDFKKDILKQEIEIVQQKINHFDILRYRSKQMAIALWLPTFGYGLSQYANWIVVLAILVPIPLWYIESHYHACQEGLERRFWAIRTFIRDGKYDVQEKGKIVELVTFFSEQNSNGFPVPDYYGNKTIDQEKLREYCSKLRNFFKPKTVIFYLPLSVIALITAVLMFAGIITKSGT